MCEIWCYARTLTSWFFGAGSSWSSVCLGSLSVIHPKTNIWPRFTTYQTIRAGRRQDICPPRLEAAVGDEVGAACGIGVASRRPLPAGSHHRFPESIETYIGCPHPLLPAHLSSYTPHSGDMLNCRLGPCFVTIGYMAPIALCASLPRVGENNTSYSPRSKDASVLILGGGVSGIITARTLNENGITNFRIIEARDELGGDCAAFHSVCWESRRPSR